MSEENILNTLWERAKTVYLLTLQTQEEREQAERHFCMITSVSQDLDANSIKIYASNSFAADMLRDKYHDQLVRSLHLVGASKSVNLDFLVDETASKTIVIPTVQQPQSQTRTDETDANTKPFVSTMPLNEEYTFKEFVTGPSNSWAYAAAKGVAEHPGKRGYNPLFIHGGTGLGKTHLMQSIGNEIRRKNPRMSVCYLTAEEFLNEYVTSLQNGEIHSFREKYRKIDVLLVDDVQFFQKGKQCQEEFFNTFNALTSKEKQIVMTSDVAPKNLPAIEERLISRFEGGMVQEIEMPSYETRLAILKKKSESITPQIPETTLKFIAQNIKSHVRAMEGALAKVNVMMRLDRSIQLNDDVLSHLLKDFIEKEKKQKKVTIEEIQEAVASHYSVTKEQILSSERTASLVTPRQLAMYIARKFSSKNLADIANKFGRTHATILHGVKTISKRLDVELELKDNLEHLLTELGYDLADKVD